MNGQEVPGADTLQLAVIHDEFAAAIREKRAFQCDGAMGLRDLRIVEAIYESARRDGVSVPVRA